MIQKNKLKSKSSSTEWIISTLPGSKTKGLRIAGAPEIKECKYGKAVAFNGTNDGIFLDEMPLAGLKEFTIEIIMNPASGGNFEQRFLHCGEIQGDRVLLELRSTDAGWYYDAFVKAGDMSKALIDPLLLHKQDKWYHVAYVVNNGKLESYVNGKKELESDLDISPLTSGQTSIGVRQNEVSWFKGMIYKIRITPKALKSNNFMDF